MTQVARKIDSWKFWMMMYGIGLAVAYVLLTWVFLKQGREEAARAATSRATSVSQVSQCFASVKSAPLLIRFVQGQLDTINNSILSTEAVLAQTPNPDPLHAARVKSLARLEKAKTNALLLRAAFKAATPTVERCVEEAKKSGVPYQQYLASAPPSKTTTTKTT